MSVVSNNAAHVDPYKMSRCVTQPFCFLSATERVSVRDRTPAVMANIRRNCLNCSYRPFSLTVGDRKNGKSGQRDGGVFLHPRHYRGVTRKVALLRTPAVRIGIPLPA